MHDEQIEILEEERSNKFKKILLIAIALFMIILTISYAWINYNLDDVIIGLVKSEVLEENKVRVNDTSQIIFKEDTYKELLKNYLENQDKEFKACLIGEIKSDNYEVTQVIIPEMTVQEFNRVVSKGCPDNTIIELHSQPYRKCAESEQDIKTKEIIKKDNPERLMAIMCEKERFSFY